MLMLVCRHVAARCRRLLGAGSLGGVLPDGMRDVSHEASVPTDVMAAAYGQTASPESARSSSAPDLSGMRRELAVVLDAHEGSRSVFRYLAHFERRLASKGLEVLDEMSVQHLRRALAQFEAIITDWSPVHLAELRSRMAVALSARDSGAAMWKPAQTLSQTYEPKPMPLVARAGSDRTASRAGRAIDPGPAVSRWSFESVGDRMAVESRRSARRS
jgi:hypothetical protein